MSGEFMLRRLLCGSSPAAFASSWWGKGGLLLALMSALVLFAPSRVAAACESGFRWRYDDLTPSPPVDRFMAMIYDKSRHESVLVTGTNDQRAVQLTSETWVFNGTAWTRKSPVHSPPPYYFFRMTYDERRGVALLLGLIPGNRVFLDTLELWEWNGSDWSSIPRTGAWPNDRFGWGMAYDNRRGKHVVFGGNALGPDGIYHLSQETWEYDGGLRQWELRSTTGPAPRVPGGMAFDAARGVTLMVAGIVEPSPHVYDVYDDTWVWNGIAWAQQPAWLPGGPAEFVSLVYDEFNKVVWTFGAGFGYDSYRGTFAWDGIDYRCRPGSYLDGICTNGIGATPSLLLPPPNANVMAQLAPAAYDADRFRVVALTERISGSTYDFTQGKTWELARGNRQPVNFIDWRNPNPPGDGTAANPFLTVPEALPCVTDGSTLFIQGGTYQAGLTKLGRRVEVFALGGPVTIR